MSTTKNPPYRGGPSALHDVPFDAIEREYADRKRRLDALREKRADLQAQLDAVDATIAAATGGTGRKPPRLTGRNPGEIAAARVAAAAGSKAQQAAAAAVASMKANNGRSFKSFVLEALGGLEPGGVADAAWIVSRVRAAGYCTVRYDPALAKDLNELARDGALVRDGAKYGLGVLAKKKLVKLVSPPAAGNKKKESA